jgi:hypothetical protein
MLEFPQLVKRFLEFMVAKSSYQSAQKPDTYSYPSARSTQTMPNPLVNPFYIILPITPRYPSFHPPSVFPTKNLHGYLICRTTSTCPAILTLLIRPPNNIWWGVLFKKLVVIQSSPVHSSLPFLRPKYLPQNIFYTLRLCVSFSGRDQFSQPNKTADKLKLCIF